MNTKNLSHGIYIFNKEANTCSLAMRCYKTSGSVSLFSTKDELPDSKSSLLSGTFLKLCMIQVK